MKGHGYKPDLEVQSAMAGYLERAVVGDATGEADGDRCAGELPSVRYYLGTLAPLELRLPGAQHRRGKETANSLGMEFEVTDPGVNVELRAVASCYYKVFPTLDEQLRFDGGRDDPAVRRGREYRLAPVFKRVEVDSGPVKVRLEPGKPLVKNIGRDELTLEFQRVRTAIAGDPDVDRRDGEDRSERRVPGHVLTDERLFVQWLAELRGTPVLPEWQASMTLLARPAAGGKTRVAVSLENLSEDPTVAARRPRRGSDRRHDDAKDQFLFRARLEVAAAADFITPIQMDLGPDAYRYDPELPAYANNCGVEVVRDRSEAIVRLFSTPAPVHETYRAVSTPHPSCRFDVLAGEDALPALPDLRHRHAGLPRPRRLGHLRPRAGPARPGRAQAAGPLGVRSGGQAVRRRDPVAGTRSTTAAGLPARQPHHAQAGRDVPPEASRLAPVPARLHRQPAARAGLAGARSRRVHRGSVGGSGQRGPDGRRDRAVVSDWRRED